MEPSNDPRYVHIEQVLLKLQIAHEAFHRLEEPGPDSETVMVTLAERDLLLIGMALPALQILFLQNGIACFEHPSGELQERIMEVVRAQRPEWTNSGTDDES